MKFLADIPIARATIQHLIEQGHDVASVRSRLSPTASDPAIIRLAASENRVILCFDLDFSSLVALSNEKLPSIITFRLSKSHPRVINERLDRILPDILDELSRGALGTVEDHRVRIRRLPIHPPAAPNTEEQRGGTDVS